MGSWDIVVTGRERVNIYFIYHNIKMHIYLAIVEPALCLHQGDDLEAAKVNLKIFVDVRGDFLLRAPSPSIDLCTNPASVQFINVFGKVNIVAIFSTSNFQ